MATNDVLVQSSLQTVPTVNKQQQGVKVANTAEVVSTPVASNVNKPVQSDKTAKQEVQKQQQLEKLHEKIVEINSHLQIVNRNLQFNVDEESGYTVVKVINSETDELVRQIPSEEILNARNAINEFKGLLLETKT